LDRIPELRKLDGQQRFEMRVVASVLPFRVNRYVVEELIDWNRVPDDPIFQLTFPQRGMLDAADFDRMAALVARDAPQLVIKAAAQEIRAGLNPHPAGQVELNVPQLNGQMLPGMQHKYRETVLFFPSRGQVCHAYCTFCFRWAQFVGDKQLQFASAQAAALHRYLAAHREVTDVLVTGGDPMVLTFWPHRFVSDSDADGMLRLLERLVGAGKHVALMAHYNHWRELDTPMARQAIRRVRDTGVVIRSQGPLLRHINDDARVWARLWRTQVRHGIVPYYMFVERDTGARRYFEVPLHRAWQIYRDATQQVSGLGRTARGPSMSAEPGKIEIQGVTEVGGERVFVLRFLQGRNPDWVQRPFFARYDEQATWLDDLQPALGAERFFFAEEFGEMKRRVMASPDTGQTLDSSWK
jgi:L-lysine 2,3-aminomutase